MTNAHQTSSDRQLAAIVAAVAAAESCDAPIWLRGGWAMDFFIGKITRPHLDVDLFCWTADVDRLTGSLVCHGFIPDAQAQDELGRDYLYGDIEVQLRLLGRDDNERVVVPAGPYAGELWPQGMLDYPPGRIDDVTCPIISPEAQIEIKEMMPVWVPGMPVRDKDQQDIALLRRALAQAAK